MEKSLLETKCFSSLRIYFDTDPIQSVFTTEALKCTGAC